MNPPSSELPPEVRDFLRKHFDSIDSLEIVLLLHRSPDTFWTEAAISQQLGLPKEAVTDKIAALTGMGLLVRGEHTGAYRFAPVSDDLRAGADALMQHYSEQRANVVNAIYAGRLEGLRAFSDAFRFKGK